MKISKTFKTALVLGIGVGVGIGYLVFDEGVRAQANRKFRKGVKMAKRQTEEARQSALELLNRGEKELKQAAEVVADKSRRIYREVAG